MSAESYYNEQLFKRYNICLNNGDTIACELLEAETPSQFIRSRWQGPTSVLWSWGNVYSESGQGLSSYKVAVPFHAISCIKPID